MNITLINHYAGSPRHGMEYRPFYMAREWARAGHDVTIVAASCAHSRATDPQIDGPCSTEYIEGIRYVWLKTPPYNGNGVRRAVNIFAFVGAVLRRAKWIAAGFRPDLVIASSTYPLDIVPAARIARLAHAKLMFEVHDLWPLSPIQLGGMSPRHPFIMLLQWAEDFAYRRADWVVSMLPNAKPYMLSRGMPERKFLYVPNGVDIGEFESSANPLPAEHDAAIDALRKEGRFIVGYAGAHGLANALDSVVRAAAGFGESRACLVFVGDGPEKPALQALARSLGLGNVRFLPPVPRGAVPTLVRSMDAMIVSLKRSPLFEYGVSPNKLMDYMMAARPVIHAINTSSDVVSESRCGVSVAGEDSAAISKAVLSLMALPPGDRAAMGLRGRDYIVARHDYRVLACEFLKPLNV